MQFDQQWPRPLSSHGFRERFSPTHAGHAPKGFDDLDCDFYDVIISFSPEAHARAQDLTRNVDCDALYWPVDNLAGLQGSREERLRAYRSVRDDIIAKLALYLPADN